MDEFTTIEDDTSDILFTLHQFNPPLSPVSNDSQTAFNGAEIIQKVLHSQRTKNALTEIASKQGVRFEILFDEAQKILEDIGHSFTLKSIRFVAYFIRKIFRNIYTGIRVNKAGMRKVQELSKEFPVVLIPSHRSYADFLLVSFVCFIFHLPLPVIAAAKDFKNMTIIGGLLRSCGAFYMKRSFRSDELYWTLFCEYVQCLVLNSGTTMEFFLEGTRSRSGKSLHPKQGLLSILTDLYFTSRVPDIIFCPVSISYERVLEETLLARELLGIPKPKESLKGLFNARSVLSADYGYAYLYFGEPISLRDFVNGNNFRLGKSCIPRSIRNDPSSGEMLVVRQLGSHIMKKIQDHLIILPNMVVASIMLQNPTGIELEMLIEQYIRFCGYFKTCNIPVVAHAGQDSRSAVMESLQLLESSLLLTDNNTVCLVDPENFSEELKNHICILFLNNNTSKTSEENSPIRTDNDDVIFKQNELSNLKSGDREYLVELTCYHLQLAHQRNQLLHWFYVPAMIMLSKHTNNVTSEGELYSDAKMLGDLLCVEVGREDFVTKEEFFAQLNTFKELGILQNSEGLFDVKITDVLLFILNLWKPLLTAYWVVYSYILESCAEGTEYNPDTIIHNCQEFALFLFLKGVVSYLEIQSLELLKNGLKSIQRLHIVQHLKHHADKRIVLVDRVALYKLVVKIESFLQLSYNHPTTLLIASKL